MRLFAVALVFIVTMASGQTTAATDESKGRWLFHSCQASIRVVDSGDKFNPSDDREAAACLYYIQGFWEGKPDNSGICGTGTTWDTLIRVYVKFMEDHPKLMDENRSTGFLIAMWTEYPCKAASTKSSSPPK